MIGNRLHKLRALPGTVKTRRLRGHPGAAALKRRIAKRSEMATIKEVAQLAGVSTATVSRALSGARPVNADVAARVLEASHALGYRPNRVARSLRTQVSTTLGLIISDVQNPFFTAVARAAERTAADNGYSLVLCNSDDDLHLERRYLDVLVAEQVAGLILTPADEKASSVDVALAAGIPVVSVDRRLRTADLDTVLVDNAHAVHKAVDLLVREGCRRVAVLVGPEHTTTAAERLRGYRDALTDHQIPEDPGLIVHSQVTGGDVATLHKETKGLITEVIREHSPDSLVITNGPMIAGSLAALADTGRHLGEDLAVVVFDDMPLAEFIGLTSIVQPTEAIAQQAVELLLSRVAGSTPPPHEVVFKSVLTIRTSSSLRRVSPGRRR